MTATAWRCVEAAAGLLTPCEREWVLGDLEEAERGFLQGLVDVMGLVGRRQIALWRSWRPWLAAFGLALPCSFLLMGFSLVVAEGFRYLPHFEGAGLRWLLGQAVVLSICAWSYGFTAGSLSRRTLWASATACLLPCFFCLSKFDQPHRSPLELLVFAPLAVWGAWLGYKEIRLMRHAMMPLAIAATLLTVADGSGPWLCALALLWPAWFMALSGFQPRRAVVSADG